MRAITIVTTAVLLAVAAVAIPMKATHVTPATSHPPAGPPISIAGPGKDYQCVESCKEPTCLVCTSNKPCDEPKVTTTPKGKELKEPCGKCDHCKNKKECPTPKVTKYEAKYIERTLNQAHIVKGLQSVSKTQARKYDQLHVFANRPFEGKSFIFPSCPDHSKEYYEFPLMFNNVDLYDQRTMGKPGIDNPGRVIFQFATDHVKFCGVITHSEDTSR
ncbi:hypothetical protein H0H93_005909, partial [Arthromyces matolae]